MTDTELLWLSVQELPTDPQDIQRNILSSGRLTSVFKTDPERFFATRIGKRFQNTIATVDRVNEYIDRIECFVTPYIDDYNNTAGIRGLETKLAIARDPVLYSRDIEFGLKIRDRSSHEVVWGVTFQTFSHGPDPQRAIAIQQRPTIGMPALFGDAQDFPVRYTSRWFDETTIDFKDKLTHLREQHESDGNRTE